MRDQASDKLAHGFTFEGISVYPHLKLTNEEFPRLLATRIIREDSDEYFGAFLNKTSVRILIDFLNRVFRLRSCDIGVDGKFPVPCTQYFAKRCLAPCVSKLCSSVSYSEMVDLVRHFLRNDRVAFLEEIQRKIEAASEELRFEEAAYWRDILQSVKDYWSKPRWHVWLDDSVDTYEIENGPSGAAVTLITQRGRRMLGNLVFDLGIISDEVHKESLGRIMLQFYRFHLPREIRVSQDFSGRRRVAVQLSQRFSRKIAIKVLKPGDRRPTTERALSRTRHERSLRELAQSASPAELQYELQSTFDLKEIPKRIEAIDAAHISGKVFTAAAVAWEDGELRSDESEQWLSDQPSEPGTISSFVLHRFGENPDTAPDLLLIDGGMSQLRSAIKGLSTLQNRRFTVLSAVKPRRAHSEISHFLVEDGRRIEFDPRSDVHRLLKVLRDEAHDLCNSFHREVRDTLHFYESKGVTPLVVPIRFDEKGGDAADLRPIVTR